MAQNPEHEHYFASKAVDDSALRRVNVRISGRDVELFTAGGVFSPEHIDAGTAVLLYDAPKPPLTGNLLDLGCGWGPIALTMATEAPDATVWAVDINERALDLVRRNAALLGLTNVRACLPDEVPSDVSFETIWSNPPIRVGKEALHELLLTWLPRLGNDASAYLVVQKHLGADSLQTWLATTFADGYRVSRSGSSKGFRVIEVSTTGPRH
ncbi:MAG TPA: methyltransferase [Candidatus Lumbricidophila sp.]|nr:methyltransferase [Candidatus Lumbricidophila sp.]